MPNVLTMKYFNEILTLTVNRKIIQALMGDENFRRMVALYINTQNFCETFSKISFLALHMSSCQVTVPWTASEIKTCQCQFVLGRMCTAENRIIRPFLLRDVVGETPRGLQSSDSCVRLEMCHKSR